MINYSAIEYRDEWGFEKSLMSVLFVIFIYAIWSSVFSLGKIALQYSPPFFLTGFRMVSAGILILLFLFFKNRFSLKLDKKFLLSILLLAFFSIYLTNVLEFWGLQYLSAAKTCFIYSLSPFFSALFSYLHFKEKMNVTKWIGLLIGFLAIIPVLMIQTGAEELLNAFSFFSWPSLAIIGAALSSVYGWTLLRLIVKDEKLSPSVANGYSMLFGGALALLHSFFVETWSPFPVNSENGASFLKISVCMIILYNILCYNLYGILLKRYTATLLSFIGLLSPIFASLNAWIFLGERPSWILFLSTTLIAFALWIIYRAEIKQGYIKRVFQN